MSRQEEELRLLAWMHQRQADKLRMHSGKPHWVHSPVRDLELALHREVAELTGELQTYERAEARGPRGVALVNLILEAADVANFAAMLADVARGKLSEDYCLPETMDWLSQETEQDIRALIDQTNKPTGDDAIDEEKLMAEREKHDAPPQPDDVDLAPLFHPDKATPDAPTPRPKKSWTVWMEGHEASGSRSQATCLGSCVAPSFKAAVSTVAQLLSSPSLLDLESDPPTYWGCRFFDNEADARKRFG